MACYIKRRDLSQGRLFRADAQCFAEVALGHTGNPCVGWGIYTGKGKPDAEVEFGTENRVIRWAEFSF
jgi:hypothetical protein